MNNYTLGSLDITVLKDPVVRKDTRPKYMSTIYDSFLDEERITRRLHQSRQKRR